MKKASSTICSIIAFLISAFVVAPFGIILINSFKTKKEAAEMGFSMPAE